MVNNMNKQITFKWVWYFPMDCVKLSPNIFITKANINILNTLLPFDLNKNNETHRKQHTFIPK